MLSAKTQANLWNGVKTVFPALEDMGAIAHFFGVTPDMVARNPPLYKERLARRQACAVFHGAPTFKQWVRNPDNLALLRSEACLYAYIEGTARHVGAEALRATADILPGAARMADAMHRHNLANDPWSLGTGVDHTSEGALLQAIAGPGQRPGKFIDIAAPIAKKAQAGAARIDIPRPDAFQKAVGKVGHVAPVLVAAALDPFLGAGAAASGGAEQAYEDARAHGATVEQAEDAALRVGPIDGLLAAIPGEKILGSIAPGLGGPLVRSVRPYVDAALANGGLSAGMQVNENLAAQRFDPHRRTFDGAVGAFGSGALFGTVVRGVRDAVSPPSASAGEALDLTVGAVRETTLPRRAPGRARELLRRLTPDIDLVIPTRTLNAALAARPKPEAEQFVNNTGIADQLQADPNAEGQIRIPLAYHLFAVGADPHSDMHEALSGDLAIVPRGAPANTPGDAEGPQPGSPNAGEGGSAGRRPVAPPLPIQQRFGANPHGDTLVGLPPKAIRQIAQEFANWRYRELLGDTGVYFRAADLHERWSAAQGSDPTAADGAEPTPNRGFLLVSERQGAGGSKKRQAARAYEERVSGMLKDAESGERIVPALGFDNPNPRGDPFVKWDGVRLADGRIEMIDRKTRIFTFTSRGRVRVTEKVKAQLKNQSIALHQNPDYVGVIEVPTEASAAEARAILGRLLIGNIEVRSTGHGGETPR